MNKDVIIIGAGGHARVIADIVRASGDRVLGFLDDSSPEPFDGIPLLGGTDKLSVLKDRAEFVVGIGSGNVRERFMQTDGIVWYTAKHPTAVIGGEVSIGEGSVLMANTVVNACTVIGRGCIINTAATIDHDNLIGDFAHVSVGAHTAGTVSIGKGTWIGIGAVVSNNISVCGGCMLGAGAVVVKSITEPGVYVGVPARRVG